MRRPNCVSGRNAREAVGDDDEKAWAAVDPQQFTAEELAGCVGLLAEYVRRKVGEAPKGTTARNWRCGRKEAGGLQSPSAEAERSAALDRGRGSAARGDVLSGGTLHAFTASAGAASASPARHARPPPDAVVRSGSRCKGAEAASDSVKAAGMQDASAAQPAGVPPCSPAIADTSVPAPRSWNTPDAAAANIRAPPAAAGSGTVSVPDHCPFSASQTAPSKWPHAGDGPGLGRRPSPCPPGAGGPPHLRRRPRLVRLLALRGNRGRRRVCGASRGTCPWRRGTA